MKFKWNHLRKFFPPINGIYFGWYIWHKRSSTTYIFLNLGSQCYGLNYFPIKPYFDISALSHCKCKIFLFDIFFIYISNDFLFYRSPLPESPISPLHFPCFPTHPFPLPCSRFCRILLHWVFPEQGATLPFFLYLIWCVDYVLGIPVF